MKTIALSFRYLWSRPLAAALVQEGWRPLWVVEFPMFEYDADEQRCGCESGGEADLTVQLLSPCLAHSELTLEIVGWLP